MGLLTMLSRQSQILNKTRQENIRVRQDAVREAMDAAYEKFADDIAKEIEWRLMPLHKKMLVHIKRLLRRNK